MQVQHSIIGTQKCYFFQKFLADNINCIENELKLGVLLTYTAELVCSNKVQLFSQ